MMLMMAMMRVVVAVFDEVDAFGLGNLWTLIPLMSRLSHWTSNRGQRVMIPQLLRGV